MRAKVTMTFEEWRKVYYNLYNTGKSVMENIEIEIVDWDKV